MHKMYLRHKTTMNEVEIELLAQRSPGRPSFAAPGSTGTTVFCRHVHQELAEPHTRKQTMLLIEDFESR